MIHTPETCKKPPLPSTLNVPSGFVTMDSPFADASKTNLMSEPFNVTKSMVLENGIIPIISEKDMLPISMEFLIPPEFMMAIDGLF